MKNVLIVEDDRINLSCAEMALKGLCIVTPTASASQALQYLDSNTPDLILLDVSLPFMDGFELIKTIRSGGRSKNIAVIFLTSSLDESIIAKGREMGALDFVKKPFIPSILVDKVDRAIHLSEDIDDRIKNGQLDIPDQTAPAPAPDSAPAPEPAVPVNYAAGTPAPVPPSPASAAPAYQAPVAPTAPTAPSSMNPADNQVHYSVSSQMTMSSSDVTERSIRDQLTGLFNRSYAGSLIDAKLSMNSRGMLFVMGLDNTGLVNEMFGNIAGDNLLKLFGEALRSYTSVNDVVCRLGGDQFAVYFDGMQERKEAEERASLLKKRVKGLMGGTTNAPEVTFSAGISCSPDDGSDFEGLLDAAGKALYHVKQSGKNAFHFYGKKVSESEAERDGRLVDIKTLAGMLESSDGISSGAYKMEFDDFHQVYNFIKRTLKRENKNVQCVLFTLMPVVGKDPDTTETDLAVEMLEQAVFESLRTDDVATRYSNRQVVVILMNAAPAAAQIIVQRIADVFYKRYLAGKFGIGYDFVQMNN